MPRNNYFNITLHSILVNLMVYLEYGTNVIFCFMKKTFLIVDSNSVIHRAFHGIPPLRNKEGVVVNAVYGFFSILMRIDKDLSPDQIITTFDLPGPTFRHIEFKEYKAKRPPTHKDLIGQFSIIKDGLKKMNVPIFEKEGFEADDMIGTIAKKISEEKECESIILSGDKDNLQLVSDKTSVCLFKKGINNTAIYDIPRVLEEYKLSPSQLIDFNGLKGDKSDNIPGVSGVGEKTALNLILKFKSIQNIYKNLDSIPSTISEKLRKDKEMAIKSKYLVTIKTDIDLDFSFLDYEWDGFYHSNAIDFFEDMGFKRLIKRAGIKKNLSLFD